MKNQTNDGILCDYCGDESKGDFVYYSFDFHKIYITGQVPKLDDAVSYTADLCEQCMGLFRGRLLEVSGAVHESPTRCDVTGADCSGVVQYYRCCISKISVSFEGQDYKCSGCGKASSPQAGPCECGNDKLVRNAAVNADKEYLELNFSQDIFSKFEEHIKHTSALGDAEWAKQ